jgi:GT2 family glycosyltransferase
MKPLAIVIPVFNQVDLTVRCLTHLRRVMDRKRDTVVMVVDNGSTDGSAQTITAKFPWVDVVQFGTNMGFAYAVNAGMLHSPCGCDFLTINNDVFLDAGFEDGIEATLEHWGEGAKIGIIGAKLRTSRGHLHHCGAEIGQMAGGCHYGGGADHGQFDYHKEVEYVAFACAYIQEAALQEVGWMAEEEYFLYYEDVDYCYQMRAHGWKVVYSPLITGVHLHNQTGRHLGGKNQEYERQSKRTFLKKWIEERNAN